MHACGTHVDNRNTPRLVPSNLARSLAKTDVKGPSVSASSSSSATRGHTSGGCFTCPGSLRVPHVSSSTKRQGIIQKGDIPMVSTRDSNVTATNTPFSIVAETCAAVLPIDTNGPSIGFLFHQMVSRANTLRFQVL